MYLYANTRLKMDARIKDVYTYLLSNDLASLELVDIELRIRTSEKMYRDHYSVPSISWGDKFIFIHKYRAKK